MYIYCEYIAHFPVLIIFFILETLQYNYLKGLILREYTTGKITRAGIFKESMGARNRGGIGLLYRPARLHRLVEFIPWNRFLGSINVLKYGLRALGTPPAFKSCTFQNRLKLWIFVASIED
jgi:hypothetical protein